MDEKAEVENLLDEIAAKEKKARDLIIQGYYQVSGKYRMLSKLDATGCPEQAHVELDRETFQLFRKLGGTTWVEGAHRLAEHQQRAKLLDLLQKAGVDLKEVLTGEMTVRDLYIRLGGAAPDKGRPRDDSNVRPRL